MNIRWLREREHDIIHYSVFVVRSYPVNDEAKARYEVWKK